MKRKIIWFGVLAVAIIIPKIGLAATFSITLDKDTFTPGTQFVANIKIDSEDASVNAAQATINFSRDTLEVVSIDKESSVFNFWLQDPAFDNAAGQLSFIGGSTSGFTGKSLEALKVNFKVKGAGAGSLTFSDGAITASDGSGTNLLSGMKGAQFQISGVTGGGAVITPPPAAQVIPPPVQIQRTPTPAVAVSAKPALTVNLYPDQNKWSNVTGNFLVSWTLPSDVSAVATAVNKDPGSSPSTSEGLFDNKYFKALDDGIWYLHVRFRNDLGWGQTMHYKISIDTAPPAAFEVRVDESTSTDNPTPTIRFGTSDQPSGIDYYGVQIGSAQPIRVTDSQLKLPLQAPGIHRISVQAHDKAGNITERHFDLNILPIPGPVITTVSQETYLGEGPFQVDGSAPTGTIILAAIKAKAGDTVQSAKINLDANNNWNITFPLPQKSGAYYFEVFSQDSRGALSNPVTSAFKVRPRPLFIFLGLEITSGILVIILLLILIGGFFAGYFWQKLAKEQRGRKVVIAQRDISVIFNLLGKDIDKMLGDYSDGFLSEGESKEIEFYLKRMKDNLDKMKRYMSENVEEIKD